MKWSRSGLYGEGERMGAIAVLEQLRMDEAVIVDMSINWGNWSSGL
jgi:hypothetical protein